MSIARQLLTRDAFLSLIVLGVGGLATLVVAIPIIGYVLSPLLQPEKAEWKDLGSVGKYKVGDTVEVKYQSGAPAPWSGTTATQAVWLRRNTSSSFTAYAIYCTHLGCPIHWISDAHIFLCPCHGSVFNADGTGAGGPAPRPLFQYETQIKNGRIFVKTHTLPVVT
jgi:menaquinol-cytochrome c reductase iron-sulfur subunit